jgi:LPXTG-site transpeptidase (sortase) family protein
VHIGGIVIEVETSEMPRQIAADADAAESLNDEAASDHVENEEENKRNGFPFGIIFIVLLFIGGIILAYFFGKKGKTMLAVMRRASCFLLALVIVGSLLLGTSQNIYAAELPRYVFGVQNTQAAHFNESSPETLSSEARPQQNADFVMHFNPSIATSDGISVRASPTEQPQSGSVNGYTYGDRIGVLTVERLGRRINVIAGATMSAMNIGGGHFSFSGLNSGNTALIGHNRGSTNGFFSFVRLLREGDIITLEAGGIVRSYAVAMVYYVEESDFSPLMQFGDDRLTLVTCREYFRSQRRIAVAFSV